MKKILILLFTLLFFSFPRVLAKSYRYEWENTYIDVTIQSSIYNYTALPQAKLYIDNRHCSDASIEYNRNGDWLYYLKDVNTNKPGEYKVWYKAIEHKYKPGNCENYKQLITFNVYDDIAPVIYLLDDEISINVKTKPHSIDFKSFYSIKDNLKDDCVVNLDLDLVDFNRVGSYEALITAVDGSGNSDTEKLKINIVDKVGPVINYLGKENKLVLEKGKEVDWKKYFKAVDDLDGDVFNTIRIEGLDINKIGEYRDVLVSFNDHENNISTYRIDVAVVDLIFPVLELSHQQITLEYETKFEETIFTKYIKQASDNGINMFENVKIDYSTLINQVGSYEVTYELTDLDGNTTKKVLKVNLVSMVKPSIRCENIEIKEGEIVDITKHYFIEDPSDPNILDSVNIDYGSFDNNTPGIYYVTITCYNSSGLFNHGIIAINVLPKNDNKINLSKGKIIVIVLLCLVFLGFLGYYLYKRKKEKRLIEDD